VQHLAFTVVVEGTLIGDTDSLRSEIGTAPSPGSTSFDATFAAIRGTVLGNGT
jgi:hypothetical protein